MEPTLKDLDISYRGANTYFNNLIERIKYNIYAYGCFSGNSTQEESQYCNSLVKHAVNICKEGDLSIDCKRHVRKLLDKEFTKIDILMLKQGFHCQNWAGISHCKYLHANDAAVILDFNSRTAKKN